MTVDNWVDGLFLACFAFGILFTLGSALLAGLGSILHLGSHAHVGEPHVHHGGADGALDGSWARVLTHVNLYSISGFLTWFGLGGYILSRMAVWALFAVVGVAVLMGLAGAFVVATFLARLRSSERVLDESDYQLRGVLAHVSASIAANGVGEIVFELADSRRVEAARGLNGMAIGREAEVMILDYRKGIATVRPWEDVVNERFPDPTSQAVLEEPRRTEEERP